MFGRILKLTKICRANFISMVIFIILSGFLMGGLPKIMGWVVDNVIIPKNMDNLKYGIFAVVGLVILSGLTQYLFIYNGGKVESKVSFHMRHIGFKKLQRLSLSYYDTNSTGQTMSKLGSDIITLTGNLSWNTADITFGISSMFMISILMLTTNFKLALMVMAVMPPIYVGGFFIQNVIYKKFKKVREYNGDIIASFNEGVMGSMTIKSLSREDRTTNEFRELSDNMKKESISASYFSGLFDPYIMILGGVASLIVINVGGSQVIDGTGLTLGTLIAFSIYAFQFYIPIYRISNAFIRLQGARASGARFFELMDTKENIVDEHTQDKPGKVKGDIEFINVDFSYVENEKILKNFNLNVKQGESIALVGETGGGKSTIVNLASRFYEPTGGEIKVDGENYKNISQERLHSSLGYVLQTPFLFNESVIDNVRYGNLEATEEEVIEACKSVSAHDFITQLDKGYNTVVGEMGSKLSAGQRQLIALARAVVSNPSIFILDEATATVDTETEKVIQNAINQVLKNRTSFIIAHRLTTIVNADRILVIKGGEIVEEGDHISLLNKRGHYFNLYIKQFYSEKEKLILN